MTNDTVLSDKYSRLPVEVYNTFFGGMPIENGVPKIRLDYPKGWEACHGGCGVKLPYRAGLDDVYEGFKRGVFCMECGLDRFILNR